MQDSTISRETPSHRAGTKARLRIWILPPLAICLLVFQLVAYHHGAVANAQFLSTNAIEPAEDLSTRIRDQRDLTVAGLESISDRIMSSHELVALARAQDIDGLYRDLLPILNEGRNSLGVSHIYVHDTAGNNLLRVHQPDSSGGRIDRWTYRAAQSTGEPQAGFEAGQFGALTLRYVTPWRVEGEVIAYVELAVELTHIIDRLDEPILAAVSKSRLNEQRYRQMLGRLDQVDNWDRFSEVVVPYSTSAELLACLTPELEEGEQGAASVRRGGHRLIEYEGRWLLVAVVPFKDASGKIAATIYTYRDVSSTIAYGEDILRQQTMFLGAFSVVILLLAFWFTGRLERIINARNQTLAEQSERYELAIRGSRDAILDWDIDTGVLYFGPQWQSMLSLSERETVGSMQTLLNRVASHDLLGVESKIVDFVKSDSEMLSVEFQLVSEAGCVVAVLLRAVAVREADGRARRISGSIADISTIKSAEREMRELLEHDQLTGLISRREFLRRLDRAIKRSNGEGVNCALLFFDIDHFKVVNDSLGHVSGDELICSVANRVRECSPLEATAARLGGDEFAVLLEDIPNYEFARQYADKLRQACTRPHRIKQQPIEITISVGLVTKTKGYQSSMELLRDVDTAMYEGKKRGRDCLVEFDAEMHKASVDRMGMEQDLRKALNTDEMFLAYQPIIDLESGDVIGAEALARWMHPVRGAISPVQFIPIAEDCGLVERLGEWAIDGALQQLADWRERSVVPDNFRVSVNISKSQLLNPRFVDDLIERVASHGLSPRDLKLEVTETTVVDNRSTVTATLAALRDRSFTIMMDDFGTGHSSLSGLQNLPIDELKIDQSFVRHTELDTDVIAITSAIVMLAGHLKMGTVAEGIETREQLALLQSLGCMYGQGFLFSRPLAAQAFELWLTDDVMASLAA